MSDYINNLVARTFGLAQVVQPRLASMFEPGPLAASYRVTAPLETEDNIDTRPSSAANAEVAPPPILTAPVSQPAQRIIERRELDVPQRSVDAKPSVREKLRPGVLQNTPQLPVALPSQHVSPAKFAAEANASDTFDATGKASSTPQAGTLSTNVSGVREHPDVDSWPRIEPLVRRLIDAQPANLQTDHSTDREPAERASTTPVAAPRSTPIATPVANAPVFRSEQFANKLPQHAEPAETIRVTIGRVDVRAIFSPQTTTGPARSQTPPVNSLDDYLKQRSEGRR